MALGRVIMTLACLAMAGAGYASPGQVRLSLSLRTLETGSEVSYHPSRWLTIRRSVAFVRPNGFHDVVAPTGQALPKPAAQAMTGDIHPFGDGLRLSLGLREDGNRRLLRGGNDAADIGTAQYAPLMSIGYAGEVGEGLSIGGDVGLLGNEIGHAGGGVLVTPVDMALGARDDDRGFRPLLRLSAGYRF